jgi:hypothetical protein
MKEGRKMKTVCYYLPYSAKAINALRTIERKYNAVCSIGMNEEITITAKEEHIAKIEKVLAPLV